MKEPRKSIRPETRVFRAQWDKDGVYFYQAFNDLIADYALEHQTLGGPNFNPTRMTWIKPSFGWVLYRSGYGSKHNQNRILKIKISHEAVAWLLSRCVCKHGGGGTKGRVQWDPERDLWTSEKNGREPRRMGVTKAIQIGLSRELSEHYVKSILSVEEVTDLAHRVHTAHGVLAKNPKSMIMKSLAGDLPNERPYVPIMEEIALEKIGLPTKTDDA